MASTSQRRCVFVGNIPYDVTEEQLVEICSEVGPVVSFRLVTDRETGKPKGYGFCEYKDEETALSARRNLQGYQINGRQLRVDFAENDKNSDKNREQGHGGPGMVASGEPQKQTRGSAVHGESASHQPVGLQLAMTAASVMTGALGGPQIGLRSAQNTQQTPTADPLTLHLSKMSRNQLTEIVSSLKVMATQNKEHARQLLLSRPQLLKAVFQAQIILGMVTPQVLQTPNILQTSLHNPQQSAKPATLNLPGLPQVAQKAQPQTLLTRNQLSAPQHVSIQPIVQNPQQGKMNLMQQTPLPMVSRVSTLPPLRHPNVRPPTQVTNSLNQPSNLMALPNNVLQSSLPGPRLPDSGLQPHIPIDAQSVLLEQVLNLTPDQLNSLAPEQRQQIIQLQQGLKRERMLAAAKNNY